MGRKQPNPGTEKPDDEEKTAETNGVNKRWNAMQGVENGAGERVMEKYGELDICKR